MAQQNDNGEVKVNSLNYGMDLDSLPQYIKEGFVSFALNANIQSTENTQFSYTNEQSNILCSLFKPGYIVIKAHTIIEQNRTIFFLVNPKTGKSEIGEISSFTDVKDIFDENIQETHECKDCGEGTYNSDYPVVHAKLKQHCTYKPLVVTDCLNFNINHPVKCVHKILSCGTIIYFVDGYNNDRWINLDDLPYKTTLIGNKLTKTSEINCNKMNFYPAISTPCISILGTDDTGSLEWGSYQFVLSYANDNGDSLSKYFGLTNIVPINEIDKYELDFGQASNKSISLQISDLDEKTYSYYNLYVIKTVKNTTSMELVDTFPTSRNKYTYTGNNKTQEQIPVEDVFKQFPYYKSNLITTSNGYLLKGDLSSPNYYNWQKYFNKVKLNWVTYAQNYTELSYKKATETTNKRTYQRDEVYPFGIVFQLDNGEETSVYMFSGREKEAFDRVIVPGTNKDNMPTTSDCLPVVSNKEQWQVYNTGYVTKQFHNPLISCEATLHEMGEFAYTESTETYPNNPDIWGELAGKPIRHFKFPDNNISHIHNNAVDVTKQNRDNYYAQNLIYPIGIRIDEFSLNLALSKLAPKDRNRITGYRIVRGNRANNKSVIAKGLLYNVGKYNVYSDDKGTKKTNTHFYANYPFNDVRQDPYLFSDPSIYNTTNYSKMFNDMPNSLKGFDSNDSKQRYTFHSPDTHFYNPGLGNILKLETEEYGVARSTFSEVEGHAKYKFLTEFDYNIAWVTAGMVVAVWALSSGLSGVGIGGNVVPIWLDVFEKTIDIIKLSIPYRNFCYQQTSVGNYTGYLNVSNTGNKQRLLDIAAYLSDKGFQDVFDKHTVNQYTRETSVYLKTSETLPFTSRTDMSRFTSNDSGEFFKEDVYSQIASFYASIKRHVPDQYGSVDNIEWIDTGVCGKISNGVVRNIPDVFGGDTFITKFALKRKFRFFNDDRVGFPNDADIDYEYTRNVAYPKYYFNTTPPDVNDAFKIVNNVKHQGVGQIVDIIKNVGDFFASFSDLAKSVLKIPKTNLDLRTGFLQQKGRMYLYNFGIPFFFVESDVNTEYRFAENDTFKDYYPHCTSNLELPTKWVQEKYTPIVHDNFYLYNKDYSKQIKEHAYSLIPNNYVDKVCKYTYPNTVIYSEQSRNDETYDKWLLFKASSKHDFPREYGALKIIRGIDNAKVLTIFENNFCVYNAYNTIKTSAKDVLIGTGGMFAQPPMEYSKSELGYGGTNHNQIISTNAGTFWIDSKRTKIYQWSNQLNEISNTKYKLERWFNNNLSFEIKDKFPNVNIDNPYKGIGFSMGWDEKTTRLFITKLDYTPLLDTIKYDERTQDFYDSATNTPIELTDTKYFCPKSWTLAYKPDTESWVSFYSFKPNFYVSYPTYFQTGYVKEGLWSHLLTNTFYQTFCNKLYPYCIEYVVSNQLFTSILESLTYSQEIREYYSNDEYYSLTEGKINFNKAIIYSNTQSTGLLNLIPKPLNNLFAFSSYPKYNPDSKDILFTYYENKYSFNTFWDITKNFKNRQPMFLNVCNSIGWDKTLNPLYHNYNQMTHSKYRMRDIYFKIRLIQDVYNRYKFINFFNLTTNNKSY